MAVASPRSSRPGHAPAMGPRAVLIPVKAFDQAKRRLHLALNETERSDLSRAMAERVVEAAMPLPVAVVCDDNEVADWARRHGALVVWEPGRGLNGAVEAGVAHLSAMGVVQVTVAHADLPRATALSEVGLGTEGADGGGASGITLVPDRYGNGTNVIALPTGTGFHFSYGPGSFARHRAEAQRVGFTPRILDRPDLAWDVDEPSDLVPETTTGPRA